MTALQTAMIIKIARDEYNAINGAMPTCKEETETWLEMVIETQQDKGTFTSLLNAGLVWSNGRGKDAACGLTEAGFAAFMELAAK